MKHPFWFTILLLAVYIAIFEAWGKLKPDAVILSAVAVSVALTMLLILAKRRKYFLNRWDIFGHAAIIGDILLEGILIHDHGDRSFYLCAIAFGLVVRRVSRLVDQPLLGEHDTGLKLGSNKPARFSTARMHQCRL